MQKRAGILFISKNTSKVFLIQEDVKWTVPTFGREKTVIEDSQDLVVKYCGCETKLIPIELYQSQDQGFEYSTYICLVDREFVSDFTYTYCWASLDYLPKNLHSGLRSTLNNKITQTKIETILALGGSL